MRINDRETLVDDESKAWFEPRISFLNLPIVRRLLISVCVASAVFAAIITGHDFEGIDFSSRGFANFVRIYQFPLGLIAASVPVFALLAANHRSEQTKAQMALTSLQIARTEQQISIALEQNRFSNHYKHLEEFIKAYGDQKEPQSDLRLNSARKSHNQLFTSSVKGSYHLPEEITRFFITHVEMMFSLSQNFGIEGAVENTVRRMYDAMRGLIAHFDIHAADRIDDLQFKVMSSTFSIPGKTVELGFRRYIDIMLFVDSVLAFDENWKTPENLRILSKFKPAPTPFGISATRTFAVPSASD